MVARNDEEQEDEGGDVVAAAARTRGDRDSSTDGNGSDGGDTGKNMNTGEDQTRVFDSLNNNNGAKQQQRSWLSPVIWNILAVETGERFAYFGFRAVLVLYFTDALQYDDRTSIAYFAYTTCLAYLSPILGAVLADAKLGRYATILYFGAVYWIGLAVLTSGAFVASTAGDNNNGDVDGAATNATTSSDTTGAAATSGDDNSDNANLSFARFLSFGGLFLVCLGTGGIKPCVSAFGADQVALKPEDDDGGPGNGGDDNFAATASARDRNPLLTRDEDAVDGIGSAAYLEKQETSSSSSSSGAVIPSRAEQVRAFFSYFYVCINIGATTSIALVPLAREYSGFAAAFSLPTVFMAAALALFLSKWGEYIHHDNKNSSMAATFRSCWWLLRRNVLHGWPWLARTIPRTWHPDASPPFSAADASSGGVSSRRTSQQHLLVPTSEEEDDDNDDDDDDDVGGTTNGESASSKEADGNIGKGNGDTTGNNGGVDVVDRQLQDAAQALHVLPIMAMLPIFWCLYDQQGSVWTLQATRMELNGLQPEQMTLINPVEIMILVPLFEKCIYPRLPERSVRPLRRMSVGMLLTAISFVVSGLVEHAIEYRAANGLPKVNVFWQFPQLTILAIGEVFVSVTGLEFSYATSPDRLKAFLMAVYLLTTAVGDLFGGVLYSTVFQPLSMANVMYVCAALMGVNLVFFRKVARWWERHSAQDLLQRATAPLDESQQLELVVPQRRIV